jgi:hypothetical protein
MNVLVSIIVFAMLGVFGSLVGWALVGLFVGRTPRRRARGFDVLKGKQT